MNKKILSIFVLVLMVVSVSYALLTSTTISIENEFIPGQVVPKVVEEIEDNIKKEVAISNQGNVPAYVRVVLVANFIDGNQAILNEAAPLPTINNTDWFEQDGYYYYRHIVLPTEKTRPLFENFQMPAFQGGKYQLQVITSAIQAKPATAVETVWPVQVASDSTLREGD